MFSRSAILFPIVLAGFMALITFWINKTVEQQAPKVDGSQRHDPDYFMENFTTKQTGIDGKLRYILVAKKMTHYPDDDSTVLEQMQFTQYDEDAPYTRIVGDRANISSDGEEIEVIDNVVVTREAFEGKGEMQIFTDRLTLLPDLEIVKTERPVVIKQVPDTLIHATGMIFDKGKKTLRLLSNVKAHYEKPNK